MRDKGYDFVRFIAMALIVVWHYFTTCRAFNYYFPSIAEKFINYGNLNFGGVGVGLFFILSGALLIRNHINDFFVGTFYKRRVLRIYIPQWIGFIMAFLCTYTVNANIVHVDKMGFLISLMGMNYCNIPWSWMEINCPWLIGEWFTAVIIVLYFLFPLLRWLFINHRVIGSITIALIFIFNLDYKILSDSSGWFSLTNGLMYFWIGMLFERYKYLFFGNNITMFLMFVSLSFIVFKPISIMGYEYLPCFMFSILFFILLYQVKISNVWVNYICQYNYEIYLVHHRIYILILPALLTTVSNYKQVFMAFLIVLGITCFVAEALNRASNKILSFKFIK